MSNPSQQKNFSFSSNNTTIIHDQNQSNSINNESFVNPQTRDVSPGQSLSKSPNKKKELMVTYDIDETNRILDGKYKQLLQVQDELLIDKHIFKHLTKDQTEIEEFQEILTSDGKEIIKKRSSVNRRSVYAKRD